MATEKKLNVRLNLKYDSFENWQKSTLVLNAGEAAVAYIETGDTQEVNSVATPQTLIKIGNGKDVFKDLPVVTAKAGDVYGWAKAATKPTYEAKEISGLDARIAEYVSEEMGIEVDTDTQYTITKVNDHQYKLMSKSKGDEAFATEVATIDIPSYDDTQVKADIDALEALVGETAVATQIANAITALNLANTYAAKVHTHTKADITDFAHTHEMAEVNGLVDALAGKETAGEANKVQDNLDAYIESNDAAVALKADKTALEAEIERATGAEEANAGAISAMKDGATIVTFKGIEEALAGKQAVGDYATKAEAQAMADGKDEAIAAAKKAGDDAQDAVDALAGKVGTVADDTTVVGMIEAVDAKADKNAGDIVTINETIRNIQENAYDDTELRGLVTANTEAIEALEGTHGTDKAALEAAIALKADQTALDTVSGVANAAATKTALEEEINRAKGEEARIEGLVTAEKERAEGVEAGLKGRIETMEAFWEAAAADGTDSNVIDTLKEIQEYIAGDETGASEMAASIKQNKDAIEAMDTAYKAADTTLQGNIDTLAGTVATKAAQSDLDVLEGRMDTAEEALGTVDTRIAKAITDANLDQYATDTEMSAALERIVALEEVDHEHENADVLAGITAEKVAAWDAAETNVQADWNATEGDALILNKPTLGALAAKDEVAEADLAEALATKLNAKADTSVVEGIDGRVEALETAKGEHDGLLAGLRTDVDLKATKAEHDELAGRVTTAEGEIDGLQAAVATKAENADLEGLAGRVTTVEGVAATAVQNVTAAADGGLKATRAEGSNDVVIAIDETVTFILDCGNSGANA